MKCPTCGIEVIKEAKKEGISSNGHVSRKSRLTAGYLAIFCFILTPSGQIPNELLYMFVILVLFYEKLLTKVSYSPDSTVSGKRSLLAFNSCAVIVSFVFSYAFVSYMIGPPDPGYSDGSLYFWFWILSSGYIVSKSLVL
ncbi:MAG: hypothetical protein EHM20_05810 [Alphaproteobacteria bacterium]|nr:MAG: hypothetical protein EHM20_05810 [Alphaproteobacteria bacterium]